MLYWEKRKGVERHLALHPHLSHVVRMASPLSPPAVTRAPRILVVDDEPVLVRLLLRVLRMHGYDVRGAADGREALEQLDASPVDLVLSDVRMPVMDGPSLLAELMRRPAPPPLIFLTGYADHTHAELCAMGATAVHMKPVRAEVILEIVRTHLACPLLPHRAVE